MIQGNMCTCNTGRTRNRSRQQLCRQLLARRMAWRRGSIRRAFPSSNTRCGGQRPSTLHQVQDRCFFFHVQGGRIHPVTCRLRCGGNQLCPGANKVWPRSERGHLVDDLWRRHKALSHCHALIDGLPTPQGRNCCKYHACIFGAQQCISYRKMAEKDCIGLRLLSATAFLTFGSVQTSPATLKLRDRPALQIR